MTARPAVLLTGGGGLLGQALAAAFADHRVVAPSSRELDVADADAVDAAVAAVRPRLILGSGALTHVDDCEGQPERAYRVNALGPEHLARSAARHRARLVAVSTDYVFSGAAGRPYHEDDAPGPLGVYGWSKLAGERAAQALCDDLVVVRVSWLFGPGRASFVDRVATWGRDPDGPPVRVADDQRSVPTATRAAARAIRDLAESDYRGVAHVASCEGATRYQLARAVFDLLGLRRALEPCSLADFASPARRPADSRLECRRLAQLGIAPLPHWRDELAEYLVATYPR